MTGSQNQNEPRARNLGQRTIAIMAVTLWLWSALIAWGTYQFQNAYDVRKPLIVMAVMSGFLGVWLSVLYWRRRKINERCAGNSNLEK